VEIGTELGEKFRGSKLARVKHILENLPNGQESSLRGSIRRLAHGAGAQGAATAIQMLSTVLLVPLYLNSWSVPLFGEWMALYALVLYLNNLDIGIGAASLNAATMAYSRGDWEDFKRVQGAGWAISLALGAMGCLVVGIGAAFAPLGSWLGLKSMLPGESRLVAFALGCSTALAIPGRQLTNVFTATGEYARAVWLQNLFAICNALATAALLLAGARPGLLALVLAGAGFVYIGVTMGLLRRKDPRLLPSVRLARWATARQLGSPTSDFAVSLLATSLALHGPVLLISRLLGGGAVAVFTTTRTLANLIKALCGLVRWPVRPELAAFTALRAREKLSSVFRLFIGVEATISATFLAGLWVAGEWIVRQWTSGRIAPGATFIRLMTLAVILDAFVTGLAWGSVATNRLRIFAIAQISTAVISLVLMAWWFGRYGLLGVPLAVIAATVLVMGPAGLREVAVSSGIPPSELPRCLLAPASFVFLSAFLSAEAVRRFCPGPPWVTGGLAAAISFVVAGAVLTKFLFTREERRQGLAELVRRREAKAAQAEV
jgi:O-antigen/teichoic acid export membrane protein